MKRNFLKIILGILVIVISVGIVLYSSRYIFKIVEPSKLNWIPILATFIGFYFAGLITKSLKTEFSSLLFLSFLIFIPLRLFFFPLILYLLFFGALGIILNRKKIKMPIKIIISLIGVLVFSSLLLSQPLIIKQEGFGTDTNGNLIHAKEIWNFNEFEPKKIPNESFLNSENIEVKLQGFRGKTIYLNFWATWCGPCIAEKPILDDLKEEFKENNEVIFIDISLDNEVENWKEYLKKNNPQGIQLISKNENLTRRNFEITGIPKYIIVNNRNQYKSLRFIPAAKPYLENKDLLNKWISRERLIIEKNE